MFYTLCIPAKLLLFDLECAAVYESSATSKITKQNN